MKTVSNCDVSVPFAIPSSNIKIGISGRELERVNGKCCDGTQLTRYSERIGNPVTVSVRFGGSHTLSG